VSRTGALLSAARAWQADRHVPVPVTIDLPLGPVLVTAKVVRTEAVAPTFPDGVLPHPFAIGLAFVKPSIEARRVLAKTYGGSRGRAGLQLGSMHVSVERYCPHCYSRAVVRDHSRRYMCEACDYTFLGFRIGPLRIAF
jgi:ribosomal protein S27AE